MILDRTCICADDGQFYHCSVIWIRDWACLSFSDGEIELLVAIDGPCCSKTFVPITTARTAVSARQVPVVVGERMAGTRRFADRVGVMRTWRAYTATPKATAKGFPRRLIPKEQEPTRKPLGTLLWQCGAHRELRRLLELEAAC